MRTVLALLGRGDAFNIVAERAPITEETATVQTKSLVPAPESNRRAVGQAALTN
jgi:hypothetical protein